MKIAVDVKKFREEYYPDEDRYEHTLVLEFLGREIEIPCSEGQLQAAVAEYQQLMAGGPGEDIYLQGTGSIGRRISEPMPGFEMDREDEYDAHAIDLGGKTFEEAYEEHRKSPAEVPQVFRGRQEVLAHLQGNEDGLEEPLDGDPMAMDLLGEPEESMVDEVVVGGEPEDEFETPGVSSASLFATPKGPDPTEQPRRDMTPGHVKRKMRIKKRHQEGRAVLTREQKLQKIREKAKQIPIRKMSADEAGNPIVQGQQQRPQAHPANYDPNAPSVKRVQPAGPAVDDEDGFPSA